MSPALRVSVKLLDDTNNLLATTTTDASGGYGFFNLLFGQYQIEFVRPSMDFVFSPANAPGSNSANDSNANSTGFASVTLTTGVNDITVDAGMYLPTLSLQRRPQLPLRRLLRHRSRLPIRHWHRHPH